MSLVSIPADTGAKVVARSAGLGIGQRTIPRVPAGAVQRAVSRIGPRAGILSHAGHVYALMQQSQERWSYAARQRALAELRERIRRNP